MATSFNIQAIAKLLKLSERRIQQLAKDGIMTMSGQLQDRERFFKWLNDPDNEKFKIYPKKV